ncbi:MAG: TonB-dependent receptor [Saprospiraceae bacterium]|nr:TonB-dependent receptor [Saprospiraceae bacterium]
MHRIPSHGEGTLFWYPAKLRDILLAFVCTLVLTTHLYGQESRISEDLVSLNAPVSSTLEESIDLLNKQISGTIFCPPELKSLKVEVQQVQNVKLSDALSSLLSPLNLAYFIYRDQLIIILPETDLEKEYTANFYQVLDESIRATEVPEPKEVIIGHIDQLDVDGTSVISGRVLDSETKEEIVGATITVENQPNGTASEIDGSYALPLNAGSYTLVVQYVGYQVQRIPLKLISSGVLEIHLEKSTVLLDEVVVQAKARDANVQSTQVGVTRVSTRELEKLPSFLGEVDIVKGLLSQPGVTSIGEGSQGFNVRGGNVDQNLIMIDEGLIFNASHALGFFSSFNSDIISEAVLYKGTMPASFGGRLASALDVKVRDGSFERWHLKGGLGIVSSRLNVDGPLIKDKTSVLMSLRSTYSNWLLKQINIPQVKSSSAYFYDFNFRLAHRFNERNNLTVSAYYTEDQFSYNQEFGFNYHTAMAQMQYRKVLGTKTLSSTNLVWSRYDSEQTDLDSIDASEYQTGLQYLKFKENINYLGDNFQANLGLSSIYYQIAGNEIYPTTSISIIQPETSDDQKGIEWSIYADFDLKLSPRISIIGGIRHSIFNSLGPQNTFIYDDPEAPSFDGIQSPVTLDQKIVKTYQNFQPRLSFRYNITSTSSIKGGYGRSVQYINQIYNSETPTPTSFWQLSTPYIKPQLAHNFSIGYFQNFNDNLWITSIETFYRNIDRLFDFKGFADLLVNQHLETELLSGIGRSYGIELSVQRQVGTLHGWLNYTYSRAQRKIGAINNGQWYSSNFDKPHDFNLIANFQINRRNSLSLNFTYGTGRPITVPVNKYLVQNRVVVLNYSERNAFRIPDYHRLDFSYSLAQGFRKSKKFKTSWTFSIYNLYGRRNPYSVFVEQSSIGATRIQRLAVLGSAFPSLTFNFELL